MEILTVQDLLVQLRQPKMKGKRLFSDFLPEAWRLLNLKGDPDLVSFEALLISAIIHCIGISEYEIGKIDGINQETAKKHDSYFLALGLLKGYYHTSEDTHYIASKRHKQYLENSDYIAISYPNPMPSENLDINNPKSLPRQALSTADKRCRKELGEYLSIKGKGQKCLEEGKQRFVKEGKINLPTPLYTLENYPPDNTTFKSLITRIIKILHLHKKAALLIIVIIAIVAVLVVASLKLISVYKKENEARKQATTISENAMLEVETIEIRNKNIELKPGEDAWLDIETQPEGIDIWQLDYTSDNRLVVTTEKNHIIAHEEWPEYITHSKETVLITVQGGLIAEDKACITVTRNDGDNGLGLKGANQD